MNRHVIISAVLTSGIYIAPLAFAGSHLLDPAPWLGLVAAFVMLVSQPPVPTREWLDAEAPDRRSALLIFATMIGAQLTAVIEFGYGASAPQGPGFRWTMVDSRLLVGVVLVGTGLTLRLWAIRTLGRWFTATVRVATGQPVVCKGPYRRLRHPSYTGALLVGLGTTCALGGSWGSLLLLLGAVPAYLHRIRAEENALVASLGRDYEAYRGRTWRLVPLVY